MKLLNFDGSEIHFPSLPLKWEEFTGAGNAIFIGGRKIDESFTKE